VAGCVSGMEGSSGAGWAMVALTLSAVVKVVRMCAVCVQCVRRHLIITAASAHSVILAAKCDDVRPCCLDVGGVYSIVAGGDLGLERAFRAGHFDRVEPVNITFLNLLFSPHKYQMSVQWSILE
jgi:hypothetical protein